MKRIMAWLAITLGLFMITVPAAAQRAPAPLFRDQSIIRLTIRGPIRDIARAAENSEAPHNATLTLDGPAAETHAIRLAARGRSRRRREVCVFPPLRIDFAARPVASSLFAGQRRLRLVTHCRTAENFSNFTLLEYAAYQIQGVVTPLAARVRLARIDYVDGDSGQPFASRLGFFIEDMDDAARRNGLVETEFPERIRVAQLDNVAAARAAMFQYMLGNLDWALNAGPAGEACCHNVALFAPAGANLALIAVPYDFDYSGLVNAPYAVPPAQVPVRNVRTRRYRGFCLHNQEAQAAAAEYRTARPQIIAALNGVPELGDGPRRSATAFLERFFAEIATPQDVERNLLRTCL